MRRLFPIVAAAVGLLLAAGFYAGLVRRGDAVGRAVRLASAASTSAVHAWAFAYLWATGRRVEAIVAREGLPGWVGALAERNARKALPLQVAGSAVAAGGVALLALEWWHPVVWGSIVSFQLGAFLGEARIVANQSRLLDDLAARMAEGP